MARREDSHGSLCFMDLGLKSGLEGRHSTDLADSAHCDHHLPVAVQLGALHEQNPPGQPQPQAEGLQGSSFPFQEQRTTFCPRQGSPHLSHYNNCQFYLQLQDFFFFFFDRTAS